MLHVFRRLCWVGYPRCVNPMVVGAGHQLEVRLRFLTMATWSLSVGLEFSQHGGWVLRGSVLGASIPRNKKWRLLGQLRPRPGASTVLIPLCSIGQSSNGLTQIQEGGEIVASFYGRAARPHHRTYGLGDLLVGIFGKYNGTHHFHVCWPASQLSAPAILCLRVFSSVQGLLCFLRERSAATGNSHPPPAVLNQ